MSKRGKYWADEMAGWMLRNAPGVNKSEGSRATLVKAFTGYGECLAKIEGVIEDNQRVMRETAKAHDAVTAVLERALALDNGNLDGAERQYEGRSRLVNFVPEDEVKRRAGGMIARFMNGNGHHAPE